jgi:hypothetical protein
MTLAGRIIRGLVKLVTSIFKGLAKETKIIIPVAIAVVNGIKFAINNPVTGSIINAVIDIVEKEVPGISKEWVDKAKNSLIDWLPKILLELKLIESISEITDPGEQLKAILAEIKFSSDEHYDLMIHDLALSLAVFMSDGKLSLSEAAQLMEIVLKNPDVIK